jgi:hypothetical protein
LDKEAAGIITSSEAILKEFASKHSLNAKTINDLIKDVLKNPAFNKDEVDTDMLQRLQGSIDRGDVKIVNMHTPGDGDQVLELFMRPSEKVLRELMADVRLAGSQHFAFHEYKDPRGNRLFAGHSNGSVSFQLAQIRVGEDKVPVSIVLYIDGTYLKKGIPIRPVYSKCKHIIPDIIHDVISDIVSDITFSLNGQSVVSTMTDQSCLSRMRGVHWLCCLS